MKKNYLISLMILSLISLTPAVALAGPCEELTGAQQATAQQLLATLHPHDCCDETLQRCLATTPSRLVRQLANEVCRRVALDQDQTRIERDLQKRAESMLKGRPSATIDASQVAWHGPPEAPVTVVAYVCTRCPLCAQSVPWMHAAVTSGPLRGRVRFGLRLFPLRNHEGSAEGAAALQAAHTLGKFWEYSLKVFRAFDDFAPARLTPWAVEVGLDRTRFEALLGDPETRRKLLDSTKEGLRNRVHSTPSYFINGRLYLGEIEKDSLIDAVQEEVARVSGELCKP